MYGKTLRIPDTELESWYGLLLGGAGPARTSGPRDAKRALARALVERFWGEDAAAEAEAGFDRVFIAHELPEEIDGGRRRGQRRHAASARGDRRRRSGARAPRRGGSWPRAASSSTASRCRPSRSTCRPTARTAACCSSASASSARLRIALAAQNAPQAPLMVRRGPATCRAAAGEALQPAGGMPSGERCARLRCPLGARPLRARSSGGIPSSKARRSLKTQQHAHSVASLPSECVQVS